MATHGRGLICLTLTQERCQRLNLPLMVAQNNDANGTNFTVSIEAVTFVFTVFIIQQNNHFALLVIF
jgi:3,4-dihydroxy 2-butanone 4-phosphate synthase/GTP cyclohydrolase II